MLEFLWISRVYWCCGTIHVQLSDQTAASRHADKLFPVRAVLGALSESEQADEDILAWVLIGEECLPSSIRGVIPSEQFHILRS
jgi:hypothetical protein